MPLCLAWLVSLGASLSAIFIGEVMGQVPCVLCWYQRAFMFPLAIVLGVAVFRADREVWRYGLPLSGVGLLIAGYHVLLYHGLISVGIAPCARGPSCTDANMRIFDLLPLPTLSLSAFLAIFALVLIAQRKPR
jgi:disulfide bond formation protein DsbB